MVKTVLVSLAGVASLSQELPGLRLVRLRDIPGIEIGLAVAAAGLLVCVGMVLVELAVRRRFDTTRSEDVRCPGDGRPARVVFRLAGGGSARDVIACSRLRPASVVRCDKACLAARLPLPHAE